jgi:uncharacterized protein (TIGR03083 family)
VDIAAHIAALRHDGELLADAAQRAGLDAPVLSRPGWRVRDLVQHVGDVHRWAAGNVTSGNGKPVSEGRERAPAWLRPDDDMLVDWFRAGHDALVKVLELADPGLDCWTFMPAPSPLAFWARRQAHETAIHRIDAEAADGNITPFSPLFAADGVDELLTMFVSAPGGGLRADPPRTLAVHAVDGAPDGGPADWLVRIGRGQVEVSREAAGGDCELSGCASDLYLLLWNRQGTDGIQVTGDRSLLAAWHESVRIH